MNKKSIIVYYSQTGTTKKVAEELARRLGLDMLTIEVDKPYDGTFQETSERIRHEAETGMLPELIPFQQNLKEYDTIYLGYPIWAGNYARPISSLLKKYDFAGQEVITFCTFGSGGLVASTKALAKVLPEAKVKQGYGVRHSRISEMPAELDRFLKLSGLIPGTVEQYPEYSEQKPVTPNDSSLYEEATGSYPYPLGIPVTVGKRETSHSTDYKFTVKRKNPVNGAESKATIYVTLPKKTGAKPDFTEVVK